jgi:hypothetical protein
MLTSRPRAWYTFSTDVTYTFAAPRPTEREYSCTRSIPHPPYRYNCCYAGPHDASAVRHVIDRELRCDEV